MFYNEGMISDFFYASPIDKWVVVDVSDEKIVSIRFIVHDCNSSIGSARITLPVSSDLIRYLHGSPVDFSPYAVDLTGYTPFQKEVLTAARSIPFGNCITYSSLADRIGRPGAARAAANALGRNTIPIIIPCHRVVSKHGLGGFSWGKDLKLKLLGLESMSI